MFWIQLKLKCRGDLLRVTFSDLVRPWQIYEYFEEYEFKFRNDAQFDDGSVRLRLNRKKYIQIKQRLLFDG